MDETKIVSIELSVKEWRDIIDALSAAPAVQKLVVDALKAQGIVVPEAVHDGVKKVKSKFS